MLDLVPSPRPVDTLANTQEKKRSKVIPKMPMNEVRLFQKQHIRWIFRNVSSQIF